MARRMGERAAWALLLAACGLWAADGQAVRKGGVLDKAAPAGLRTPILIYEGWPANGEAPGGIRINEKQAMAELDEVVRLKRAGVRLNYDAIDVSWLGSGGKGSQKASGWPTGPTTWIKKCRANGIRPGLWFGADTLATMEAAPARRNSVGKGIAVARLAKGGSSAGFTDVLQSWYNRGIRLFEFDFTGFAVAKRNGEESGERNEHALENALATFRRRNLGAVLLVEEGSGGMNASGVAAPSSDGATSRRLEIFAVVAAGAARPSRVPEQDIWRSVDIESDAWVRREEEEGIPLERMEADFAVSQTDGGNVRGMHGWKGAFLLAMARGGWVKTVRGDLTAIRGNDARWMARAQGPFLGLQARGLQTREWMRSFGGSPGGGEPYGYAGATAQGAVYVAVNPRQAVATLTLPGLAPQRAAWSAGRVQFRDAGFQAQLNGDRLTLGPGQMAVVGYGAYARPFYNLGVQQDVAIPSHIEPVPVRFYEVEPGMIAAGIDPPIHGVLRVVVRRLGPEDGSGAAPADAASAGQQAGPEFTINATQSGRSIPIRVDEKALAWSGISWAMGEMDVNDLTPGLPVRVYFHCNQRGASKLEGSAYRVEY